ncbi:MAG: hypothetical protein RR235_09860 [Oscillospiraceae bacterium]
MTLCHFSNERFNAFDNARLGYATVSRSSDNDETMAVSSFGFCFVEEEDIEALIQCYGADFAKYIATCDVDCSQNNNYDSTWDNFCEWIERDGAESVREQLNDDGIEYLRLWNGCFNEIIVMDAFSVKIEKWNKVNELV